MSKTLHAIDAHDLKYRGYLAPNRWTLCVGAGISRGISPTWFELAKILIDEVFGVKIAEEEFNRMFVSSGWSLDGWIQAAANEYIRSGGSIHDFTCLIESCLYSKIREKAKGCGLEKYLATVLNFPKNEPKNRIEEVCEFLESSFPGCSLFEVARFLIDAAKSQHAPLSVLTFNADTFLETCIDLFLRREHYRGPGPHSHPRYHYVSISRPGNGSGDKIPIYHCHGSIAPEYKENRDPRDARDRLIFLEQEYLTVLSNRASWAQTVFLFHAQSTTLVFCGLSMSDANIRRWMSALELEENVDRRLLGNGETVNPRHIWVKPRPGALIEEKILLPSLLHLGVRPAWIRGWGELRHGLSNLCAARSSD